MEHSTVNKRANGTKIWSSEMESPTATIDGSEAVQRLKQLEKKTRSLQVRPVRRTTSRAPLTGVKPDSNDPLEEMKQVRQAEKKKKSIQPSRSTSATMTTDGFDKEGGPMMELKHERQGSKRIQSLTPNHGIKKEDAQDQKGDMFPVKPVGRKESDIPSNNDLPPFEGDLLSKPMRERDDSRKSKKVKKDRSRKSKKKYSENHSGLSAPDRSKDLEESILMDSSSDKQPALPGSKVGRKESKVVPSKSCDGSHSNLENRSSHSLKALGRKESKIPSDTSPGESREEHVGSSLPVKSFGRKESKIPPNTRAIQIQGEEHFGSTLPVEAFGRKESKIPPNIGSGKFHDEEHASPMLAVKAFGRKESKIPSNSGTVEIQAEKHADSFLPIKAFVRKESKAPPNTGPVECTRDHDGSSHSVKAYGRKESKFPSNSMSGDIRLEVEDRTGSSLPVKAFGRSESRTPESFISKTSPPKRSDRRSLTPGNTCNDDQERDYGDMPQIFSRRAMKNESDEKDEKKVDEKKEHMKPGFFKRFVSNLLRRKLKAEQMEDC